MEALPSDAGPMLESSVHLSRITQAVGAERGTAWGDTLSSTALYRDLPGAGLCCPY
jgi:hypothetical protein